MTVDWTHFTPYAAVSGGVLIGLAAAIFVLFNGRIAGISGIIGGLFRPGTGNLAWQAAFVAGLLLAPWLLHSVAPLPAARIEAGTGTLIVAGLLVGIGTRYGSGCTSGHGVCGLSRLSPRSLVATAGFMLAGFITVFIVRHLFA
ncbi:MAG: YeeE/YedE family protein [Propionivibrio sp.]